MNMIVKQFCAINRNEICDLCGVRGGGVMTRKEELEIEEAELYEKISKIKKEKEEIRENELVEKKKSVAKKIQYLRDNRDIILPLIEHSRTSCSDENYCNGYSSSDGYARCNKCFLIEILNGEWGDGEFEVDFNIGISCTDVD